MSGAEVCERKRCPHCKKIIIVETEQVDAGFYSADDGTFEVKLSKP